MAEDPLRTRARITALEQAFLALADSIDGAAKDRLWERFEETQQRISNPLEHTLFGPDLDEADRARFGLMAQEEWEWLKGQIFGQPAQDA